ncbi:MAG TPA: hypothetical protein VFX48_05300 [Saprospiraceae bacterium]|nr:hypothetical protein [Saprospiraceae bacterium]
MRDFLLVFHFLGLVMGLGTSIANFFLGMAISKMAPEEARDFSIKSMALSNMGRIGLSLLVISGIFLMSPFWSGLSAMPLLMAKLALSVILIILVVLINIAGHKAKNGDVTQFKKIVPLGKMTLMTGLAILVLAVYIFH